MKCPYCQAIDTEVTETRDNEEGNVTRRRRECLKCQKRFTTYERMENIGLTVIKRDGRREPFEREKLLTGLLKACEKTKAPRAGIEKIVDEVERDLRSGETMEAESKKIGQMAAKKLKELDEVAYIRFASVFRHFVDAEDFVQEVQKLVK